MIANNAKLNTKNSNTHLMRKKIVTEAEETYYHNLEFFNILISSYNNNRENLHNIKSVDELFYEFRKRIFKCQTSSPILAATLERSLKIYDPKPISKKKSKINSKLNTIKKSSSCPSFTKPYSCINSGCVYRCLFSSIQAHVTQVFKNMDFDFDNRLTYVEFRKGIIGILFGEDSYKVHKINSVSRTQRKESIISSLNPSIRNEFLKCQFDISLFFECPIEENLLFELFLRFDKNLDGIIDFAEFVREIKPPICPKRLNLINQVFNKIDYNKDGKISIEDLAHWYGNSAKLHPKYLRREWTIEQVLKQSLSYYEIPGENTGEITRDKFTSYYSIISSTIMNDAYFDLLLRKMFNI